MARVSMFDTRTSGEADGKLIHVDALRGAAVLGVVAVHHGFAFTLAGLLSFPAFYGRLGVQLFFVLSALTLCRSWDARAIEAHAVSNFFIRRWVRVAPLYYLAIAFYAAVRPVIPDGITAGRPDLYAPGNIAANLMLVHGFVPGAYNDVVPGGWSIAAEASFYLLFPVLYAIARRLDRLGGDWMVGAAIAGAWCLGVAGQVAIGRATGRSLDDPFVYSGIANQLPVFMIGIAVHLAGKRGGSRRATNEFACFLSLTVLAAALILARPPLTDQIVPTLAGASFAFLFGIAGRRYTRAGWLARLGRRSYSMYLLHFLPVWVVAMLVERVAGRSWPVQTVLFVPTLLLVVGITFVAAGATERWIEAPAIRAGRRWIARRDERGGGCVAGSVLYERRFHSARP